MTALTISYPNVFLTETKKLYRFHVIIEPFGLNYWPLSLFPLHQRQILHITIGKCILKYIKIMDDGVFQMIIILLKQCLK